MKNSIFVRNNSVLERIHQEDIHFIQAEGNYCIINTMGGRKYAVKISLTHFANKLDSYDFAQVHRGYIVRLSLIETIDTVNGNLIAGGTEFPLGRKFRDRLLKEKLLVI